MNDENYNGISFGKDGGYWHSDVEYIEEYWSVQKTTKRGAIYGYTRQVDSEEDCVAVAKAYKDVKDENFDKLEDWRFIRNSYGSEAWGWNDEVGLMDDEERAHYGV